jgi:hypothetical protein
MRWFGRGAAFGAGMMLGPAIFWILFAVAATVFVGILTHLWVIYFFGALVAGGMIWAMVRACLNADRKSKRSPAEWSWIHNRSHDPVTDSWCPLCSRGVKPRRAGGPIPDADAVHEYASLPKTAQETHAAWHTEQWHTGCDLCDSQYPESALSFYERTSRDFPQYVSSSDLAKIEAIKAQMGPAAYEAYRQKQERIRTFFEKRRSSTA